MFRPFLVDATPGVCAKDTLALELPKLNIIAVLSLEVKLDILRAACPTPIASGNHFLPPPAVVAVTDRLFVLTPLVVKLTLSEVTPLIATIVLTTCSVPGVPISNIAASFALLLVFK